ncbi:glucocorticoid receptor-like (DNA-binding domain) [Linderina pennispora]|uniref:Glucocorticoid receptor-like (DNA-binding domain) n=1 Tax=Linderina pennispora TaxID=61395 RepID=A0A1Y1WEZ3_9FUNG|nr:glucocorticoid receptor-like (DNA-binding domain) [Linderina pennispora]ORX71898.1 glucocorticoid receptor-like (DNA-binding domain) [Linderina pennispora]
MPQSSSPSTASPNQLLTDAALMSMAVTSSQPATTAISPLVTMEKSFAATAIQSRPMLGLRTLRKKIVIPAISSDGTLMICCNCGETETPSWRRHPISNSMLCNACGLYYRLHRKPRPIAYDESGKLQVIRKNAAVKREPINIGLSENIVSGPVPPFQALRLLPADGSLSLMNDDENKD